MQKIFEICGDTVVRLLAAYMRWWLHGTLLKNGPDRLTGAAVDCADYLAQWRRVEGCNGPNE
jgi:hypothetical protein